MCCEYLRQRRARQELQSSSHSKNRAGQPRDKRAVGVSMFQGPANRKKFVVTCKRCRRDVPCGVAEFPFQSITVVCCLCGEQRRYLPSEVFLGKPDHLVRQSRTAIL